MKNVVLSLKNIVKEFPTSKKNKKVHAISNVVLIYMRMRPWLWLVRADVGNQLSVNVL